MNVVREINKFAKLTKYKLIKAFKSVLIPQVVSIIDDNYHTKLLGVVPEGSLGRPEEFYDEFMSRLELFEFIKDRGPTVSFIVPDRETFDFSDNLSFLKYIMEGMTGFYYIIPIETYRLLGYTPPDLRQTLYLVREDDPLMQDVRVILGDTFLEPYAFSNSPPIDVFEGVEDFVDNNIEGIIETTLDTSTDSYESYNRGA